jgi:hypothetical protein
LGHRAIIDKCTRDQAKISQEILGLKAERSAKVTRERSIQIRDRIESLYRENDRVTSETRKRLRSLEQMRDKELYERRAKKPWTF